MNHRDRMVLDEHIAGGHLTTDDVNVVCRKCGGRATVEVWNEYGMGGYTPEECAECGESYDADSERDGGPDEED